MVMDDFPVQLPEGTGASRILCGVCVALLRALGGAILMGARPDGPTRTSSPRVGFARVGQFAIMMRSRAPLSDIRRRKNLKAVRANREHDHRYASEA
jgi:hypothetical protein